MNRSTLAILAAFVFLTASAISWAQTDSGNIATMRDNPIDVEPEAHIMAQPINDDKRQVRNYPMQPPTIPHKIDNYQVDVNVNKCMTCHSRRKIEESNAPMVSVTHYMDRDGNFLAAVSPRRYFCNQCHVVQTDAKLMVENDFKDVKTLIEVDQDQEPAND